MDSLESAKKGDAVMKDALADRGIVEIIHMLSSQGATGRLAISTGMTNGAVFFDRGQLIEARLGKLTGFQAINALASVRDASYDFNPAIVPPAQSSISSSERVLLKDFFGVDAFDREHARDVDIDWTHDDQRLTSDDDDEATLVRPRPAVAVSPRPSYEPLPSSTFAPTRSAFRPALFLLLLTVLAAAVVFAIVYRSRKPDSTASVAPAVQPAPPASVPQESNGQQQSPAEITSAVPDLSGNWKVVNTVEQTSYEAYKNMEIGFNVSINQAGKDFTGTGEKISENGRSLPAAGRTPIVVKGTIDGDKIEATFSENGAVRKTNGRFVWRIDKGSGGLTGTFISTAARTRGKSAATKVL